MLIMMSISIMQCINFSCHPFRALMSLILFKPLSFWLPFIQILNFIFVIFNNIIIFISKFQVFKTDLLFNRTFKLHFVYQIGIHLSFYFTILNIIPWKYSMACLPTNIDLWPRAVRCFDIWSNWFCNFFLFGLEKVSIDNLKEIFVVFVVVGCSLSIIQHCCYFISKTGKINTIINIIF